MSEINVDNLEYFCHAQSDPFPTESLLTSFFRLVSHLHHDQGSPKGALELKEDIDAFIAFKNSALVIDELGHQIHQHHQLPDEGDVYQTLWSLKTHMVKNDSPWEDRAIIDQAADALLLHFDQEPASM